MKQMMNTKAQVFFLFALFACFVVHSTTYAVDFAGGTGEPNDPYQIATAEQLIGLGEDPNLYDKCFILTNDIDLSSWVFNQAVIAPGQDFFAFDRIRFKGKKFHGLINGNGHWIKGLTIDGQATLGLIGGLGPGARVTHLNLDAVNIMGTGNYLGALIGISSGGFITDCYCSGRIEGGWTVGGLVGLNDGFINNSYSDGTVSGRSKAGGLVGYNYYGSVSNSYNIGTVIGRQIAGGLVGESKYGSISGSYNGGTVTGNSAGGGLVGQNQYGTITNCYNRGAVMDDNTAGGLVGSNSGSIYNSYSTASVTGNRHFGGLVGRNFGLISKSYWDKESSGITHSAGGSGLSTAQMQDINTYLEAGWDLIDETANGIGQVWICQSNSYPLLSILAQSPSTNLNGMGTSDFPYIIANAQDLGMVWRNPTASYRMVADIDLSESRWNTAVIPWFGGLFDGNNHAIVNLSIQGEGTLGLFGTMTKGAAAVNIGLDRVDVKGSGDRVGGLTGTLFEGHISRCFGTGSVQGNGSVGGLVGHNEGGFIINSFCMTKVTGIDLIGGLVGYSSKQGSIANSYSTGAVTGDTQIGGLVGSSRSTIANSYWDIESSGVEQNAGGHGLPTVQMQDINTYLNAGWDFVDETENGTCQIWTHEPNSYPQLHPIAQGPASELNGIGTPKTPYIISNASDLGKIWLHPSAAYRMDADIDLTGISWTTAVIPWFGGLFDGCGYRITNLSVEGGGTVGLFGTLDSSASVKNLGLDALDVNSTGALVGGLVGQLFGGKVSRCHSIGTIRGNSRVGGLVGHNDGGIISYSTSSTTVRGGSYIGGLLGINDGGSISDSNSSGTVRGGGDIGGLVGYNVGGLISKSNSSGSVTGGGITGGLVGHNYGGAILTSYSAGTVSSGDRVGGLVGLNGKGSITSSHSSTILNGKNEVGGLIGNNSGSPISNCYSIGTVLGDKHVGGLVGKNSNSDISNSYNTGMVRGDEYVGGLVGHANSGSIIDSYNTGTVSGRNSIGGLVGENSKGSIFNCNSMGKINGTYWRAGGLVGMNDEGSVANSYSTGTVDGYRRAGGLVGTNEDGTLSNCFSNGEVRGDKEIGGLVGYNSHRAVSTNAYSTATVIGNTSVGGLVGYNNGRISSAYSTGEVHGYDNAGGLIGYNSGVLSHCVWDTEYSGLGRSDGGVGLTSAEMMDPDILGLNGLADDPNWVLDAFRDYPRLVWEETPGTVIPLPAVDWLEGDGSLRNPYEITSVDQLIRIGKASILTDKCFVLMNDLDLSAITWAQAVIPYFDGTFNGQGYCIKHLHIMERNGAVGHSYLGLFGVTDVNAVITHLGLRGLAINGTGDYVGGLAGKVQGSDIRQCYTTGAISGFSHVGGLVGYNALGSISNSYNKCIVSGFERVGGLVGTQSGGVISRSYSAGSVIGNERVDGLVGYLKGSIHYSFWDTETSDLTGIGNGIGRSTAQLQHINTYLSVGWDFTTIWMISPGDYPRLRWENNKSSP